jgi:hypothetical protein
MRRRKLFVYMIGLGLACCLLLPAAASAADVLGPACGLHPGSEACASNTAQPATGNTIYGPNGLLTRAGRLIAAVVGMASVVMIIIGGFKFVTSSGDPSNIKSAKDTIMFAFVGLTVALLAQSIVVFVLSRL